MSKPKKPDMGVPSQCAAVNVDSTQARRKARYHCAFSHDKAHSALVARRPPPVQSANRRRRRTARIITAW